MSETDRCWACQSPIEAGQKFCKECNHWQNWRHYTNFSSTILALIIAIFSVAGLTIPLIKGAFVKPEVVLDARIVRQEICEAGNGQCDKEDSPKRTQFELWFTNLSGFDVLLSEWMYCNALSGDLMETNDEFTTPSFQTMQRTLLRQPDSAYEDQRKIYYSYTTYEASAPTNLPYARDIGCLIEVKFHPRNYFFFRIYDGDITGGKTIQIYSATDTNVESLFEALRKDRGG